MLTTNNGHCAIFNSETLNSLKQKQVVNNYMQETFYNNEDVNIKFMSLNHITLNSFVIIDYSFVKNM